MASLHRFPFPIDEIVVVLCLLNDEVVASLPKWTEAILDKKFIISQESRVLRVGTVTESVDINLFHLGVA